MMHKKREVRKNILILISIFILISTIGVVSAQRLPTDGGNSDVWGGMLNTFLNVSHNESGELRSDTVSTSEITDDTITDSDISDTTNLTLGEKITFTLGEVIDNIINGWITITGGLNVTNNLEVNGSAVFYGGNLSVNTSDLFVNTDLGRVGIGTSTPNQALEVSGQINASNTITSGGTFSSDGATTLDAGGANSVTIGSADVTTLIVLTDGTGTSEVQLPAGSINTTEILDATISADDLATSSVNSTHIVDGTITGSDITADAINTTHILDGNITSAKIAVDTIVAADIATNAVGTTEILDDTIANVDINSAAAILYSKLSFSDNIVAGDIATSAVGASELGADVVDGTELADTITLDAAMNIISNDFSVNTSNLFVDVSTGRVGIGIINPSEKLNVSGNIGATGNVTASYFFGNGSQLTDLTESQITDLQTYAINNTAGWTLNFSNIYSSDWTNVTITESQITDLVHTINGTNIDVLDINASSATIHGNLNVTGNLTVAKNIDITNGSLYQPVYPSDDGLVLYLPLSESSSETTNNTMYDRSPYGNDGVTFGITCNETLGKYGSGCDFDGVDDYITISSDGGIISYPFTMGAWFESEALDVDQVIINLVDASVGEVFYGLRLGANSQVGIVGRNTIFREDNGGPDIIGTGWHHAVGVFVSATQRDLYVDGVKVTTGTTSVTFTTNTDAISIGQWGDASPSGYFNGTIDEVMLYKRALAPEEIRTHYLRGKGFGASGAITADKFRIVNTSGTEQLILNQTAFSVRNNSDTDGLFYVDKVNNRVGIGTSSPTQTLTVSGDLNVTGTSYLGDMDFSGSTITAGVINVTSNLTVGKNIDITNGSLFQPVYGSDDGLVLYLPFSEPNGSTQYDRSPYGNEGTQFGADCNATNGKYGSGCDFGAGSNYVNLSSKPPTGTGYFSLEAWIFADSLSGAQNTYGMGIIKSTTAVSVIGDWFLSVDDGGSVHFANWRNSGADTDGLSFTADGVITENRWYHVAAVWDGTTNRVFVDGTDQGTLSTETTATNWGTAHEVGRGFTGPDYYFNGSIDEVMVYKRALTPEEIRTHYLRGSGFGALGAITADKFRIVNTSGTNVLEVNSTGVVLNEGSFFGNGSELTDLLESQIMDLVHTVNGTNINVLDVNASSATIHGNLNVTGNLTVANNIDITNGSLYQPVYGSDDGLVLYLPFSEDSVDTSTAFDRSPFGNDGTLTGGTICNVTTGKYGSGCDFDGVNDFVDLGTGSILKPELFSVEAWIKPINSAYWIVGNEEVSEGFAIYLSDGVGGCGTSSNQGNFPTLMVSTGSTFCNIPSPEAITFDQWHHITGTYDGTTGRIFVDGVEKNSSTNSYKAQSDSSIETQIGAFSTAIRLFDGSIDEVKIYKRVLSTEEIRTHYLRGKGFGASGAITADKFRIVNTSGNVNFIVDNTGKVGIGTTNPLAPLHVNSTSNETVLRLQDADGACLHNPEAGSETVSCSSDEKLKKNIKEAKPVLEEFEDIEIKDYVVKASGKEHTGVIAQEINKTHPELVHEEGGELFVEQPNPWKLLKAIQELKEMFDSLVGGNYSVGSAEMVIDEDSVGQATILLNNTSVRVEFSEEYGTEPIVTVTPVGLPNFFYGVDNINTTGFNIEISEAQDKEVVFNWHVFAKPKNEVEIVNVTDITEVNIANHTGINETQGIGINDSITNGTIEDINETADKVNETIFEIPKNETIDKINNTKIEVNQTEDSIGKNQTFEINETEQEISNETIETNTSKEDIYTFIIPEQNKKEDTINETINELNIGLTKEELELLTSKNENLAKIKEETDSFGLTEEESELLSS